MARLLLADDSVTIQRVIEMTFAAEDITVTAVSDGEQAMARITQERPDIVLADIAMPKRDGYEVAAFVKSRPDLASIPVLLLAGAFEPVDQQRAEQVQCDGVLVKPFEPQQVIARVRELIAGARGTPSPAASGVPRPVERLIAPLKLVESRRDRPGEPPPATAGPVAGAGAPAPESTGPGRGEHTVAVGVDHVLDDYFDRLDAAFASLSSNNIADLPSGARAAVQPAPVTPPPEPIDAHAEESQSLPTIASVLGMPDAPVAPGPPAAPSPSIPGVPVSSPLVAAPVIEPPDTHLDASAGTKTLAVEAPSAEPAPMPSLADAFSALLAAELGEKPAPDLSAFRQATREPVVNEALIEAVTRRVIDRLAPDLVRRAVAEVVSDTAERLVREEIARIRGSESSPDS